MALSIQDSHDGYGQVAAMWLAENFFFMSESK
jgi:hypothetical protein